VLHPRALIPIAGTRIILHVRSFLDPSSPGTEVSAQRALEEYPVKALAIVHGQAIVTVAGKGMVGVHGIAARTFAAVDAERLSVSTIFQASSESSIGFTVPEGEAARRARCGSVQGRTGERRDRQRQRDRGSPWWRSGDGRPAHRIAPGVGPPAQHQRRRHRADHVNGTLFAINAGRW
jgi:hypothetical protein